MLVSKLSHDLRVLWLIDVVSGGGGAVLSHLICSLENVKHAVMTTCVNCENSSHSMLAEISSRATVLDGPSAEVQFAELPAFLDSFKPNIVVSHWWYGSSVELAASIVRAHSPDVPHILVVHSVGSPPGGFDSYVMVSEVSKAFLFSEAPSPSSPVEVIHNGIDVDLFKPTKFERRMTFVTGTVGSLGSNKLPQYYCEAISGIQLARHQHDLVGDGGHLLSMRDAIQKVGMGNRIRLLGELQFQSPEIISFYRSLDAYLFLPTYPEPFPIAVLEAMAAGTPVIALARGGVCEQVHHGVTGFLCASIEEVQERCVQLANNNELAIGMRQAAVKRASAFSRQAMATRYGRLFERLHRRGRKPA